jgi:proline iminopeptidase
MMEQKKEALYPAAAPYNSGYLKVDGTHECYYEEFGNPKGIPVVVLHGGPGGGSKPFFHRYFDLSAFRVVVYDQRGAGRSKPFGEIKDNSPDLLVEDMEKLRKHLGIGKWHVFGGSWGSTLALLYAEEHPGSVMSLTLRGIFMMRQKELDLFYRDGNTHNPDQHEKFMNYLPEAERKDVIGAYFRRIADPDPNIHMPAASVWTRYENSTSYLVPPSEADLDRSDKNTNHTLGMARMETHFFHNHRFQPDDRILKNVDKIRHIPTFIVQGRYDTVCPPVSAWELKKAFREAHLEMVIAGHSAKEPEIEKLLVRSADLIRDTGSPVPKA